MGSINIVYFHVTIRMYEKEKHSFWVKNNFIVTKVFGPVGNIFVSTHTRIRTHTHTHTQGWGEGRKDSEIDSELDSEYFIA